MDKILELLKQVNGDREKVLAKFEQISDPTPAYLLDVAAAVKELEAEMEPLEKEIATIQRKLNALKNAKAVAMDYLAKHRLPTPIGDHRAELSWRKSERLVVNADVEDLPESYIRVKKEINKTALKQAIKKGLQFEGVILEEKWNPQIK